MYFNSPVRLVAIQRTHKRSHRPKASWRRARRQISWAHNLREALCPSALPRVPRHTESRPRSPSQLQSTQRPKLISTPPRYKLNNSMGNLSVRRMSPKHADFQRVGQGGKGVSLCTTGMTACSAGNPQYHSTKYDPLRNSTE